MARGVEELASGESPVQIRRKPHRLDRIAAAPPPRSGGGEGRRRWHPTRVADSPSQAGPNAPTSLVREALENALAVCEPNRVWLLLPWYGRSYTCDGTDAPVRGNCSCEEDNFRKKSFELLDAARSNAGSNCTERWYVEGSYAYECDDAAGLPGMAADARTQVWYDDPETLSVKYALKDEYGLGGLGVWTARSAHDRDYLPNEAMWAALPR